MGFQKATKEQAKLRLAIFGPAGAGKTFTSLRIAKGIGGKIAVIDSEEKTASKYADRFDFDVCDLEKKNINEYIKWINDASKLGYSVLIIDSISHAWQELLEEIDQLAKTKYKGNSWSAWSEGTPKQKLLVNAILKSDCHVIATMRSKTEWSVEQGNNGKSKPVRVGLAPEQGKGIEFEFDMLMELSTDHVANIIKDRTGRFQDDLIIKPGEEFGVQLRKWLENGVTPSTPVAEKITEAQTDKPAEAQPNKKLKALHAVGVKYYGDHWDTKRAELILALTKKRKDGTSTSSSKECTDAELESLTKSLQKKLDEQDKILQQHKEMADKGNAGKPKEGAINVQQSLYENLKKNFSECDNGIDFVQMLNRDTALVDMVTDAEMSADLTLIINRKAKELGVDLNKAA